MKPETLEWAGAVRLFMLRCRSLNLSPSTQALYALRLKLWREWVETQAGDSKLAETRADAIRAYLEAMRGKGWKDETVDSAFRILKTFFAWLANEGLIFADHMRKVERSDGRSA